MGSSVKCTNFVCTFLFFFGLETCNPRSIPQKNQLTFKLKTSQISIQLLQGALEQCQMLASCGIMALL